MIVLLFTFFIAAAYGQECKRNLPENMIADLTCGLAKEHIESFFKTSDPCVGMQLSDIDIDSAICNTWLSTMAGSSNTISIEKLDDLAHEIVRPSRFNKIYRNYLNRPELAKLLNDLSAHLKTRGLKFFNCSD